MVEFILIYFNFSEIHKICNNCNLVTKDNIWNLFISHVISND